MSVKKQKTASSDVGLELVNFSSFQKERTLNVEKGMISLLGTFAEQPGKALVLMCREDLEEADIESVLGDCKLVLDQQNTYYGFYKGNQECQRRFTITVIYPCQEWHISKYSRQKVVLMRETKDIYEHVMQAYMAKHPSSELKWLYQLLDKTAEQERLLLEDSHQSTGFLMYAFKPKEEVLKDDPLQFKALVIVNRRDIRSLRDLRAESLPLLENIMKQVTTYASEELNIPSNELRLFLHYKPTYFHLHVHVVHVEHEMRVNIKDYLLDDVIDHLKMQDDYFGQKTMVYSVGVKDELYQAFMEYVPSKSS